MIIVGAVLVYLGYTQGSSPTIGGNTETTTTETISLGRQRTYTITVSVGSILTYNNSYMTSEGNVAQKTIYSINVTQVQWPFLLGVYNIHGQNTTGSARMAIGNIVLPLEILGKQEVSIPIIIPAVNSGLCANLTLVETREIKVNNRTMDVYIYSMNVSTGRYMITAQLAYNKSNGILIDANYTIYGDNQILFMNRQYVLNATLTGKMKTVTPDDWFCTQPYSTDFRFTLEGTYILQDGKLTPISINDVREASLDTAIVGVIGKDGQQITMDFWKTLLASSKQCPEAKVYLIIVGPLSDPTTNALANNILERGGASESTVIVKFVDGSVDGKAYRYADLQELTSLLCGSP